MPTSRAATRYCRRSQPPQAACTSCPKPQFLPLTASLTSCSSRAETMRRIAVHRTAAYKPSHWNADGLMIVVFGLLAGGATGYFIAAKRGGSGKDKLHYAAVFGIALGLAGLFADMAVGWSFLS